MSVSINMVSDTLQTQTSLRHMFDFIIYRIDLFCAKTKLIELETTQYIKL